MAIAFDSSESTFANPASSLTYSHTMSSTAGGVLFVQAMWNNVSDVVTGVTYNGVPLTRINGALQTQQNYFISLWYKTNPSTGAHNIVISASASNYCDTVACSYTGVDVTQTDIISTSTTATGTAAGASLSVTTVKDNSWAIMAFSAAAVLSAGASTTLRQVVAINNPGDGIFDSNAPVTPAGSRTLNANFSSAGYAGIITAFAPTGSYPPPVTANTTNMFFAFK